MAFEFHYYKKKSTRFISDSYCNAQILAAMSQVLPSQRPYTMNPAPCTGGHCLHLPLLPPFVTQISSLCALLQLLFTTAKAETSHLIPAAPSSTQCPNHRTKICSPVDPLPGKTTLQTRNVEFIRAQLILCFPTSTSTL